MVKKQAGGPIPVSATVHSDKRANIPTAVVPFDKTRPGHRQDERVSLSRSTVDDAARYFESWVGYRQRFDRVPGVQVAILHDAELVLSAAYGHADVEHDVALTPSHLFRIASHSKTFTATAIMQLIELELLRLDDTAGFWLPFLDGSPLADITIRELLAHGGGVIRDGHDGDFWQLLRSFPDRAELARISLDDAGVLGRNERFKYSNIGYSLLGQIIEAATETTYDDHVREHVVDRLGLVNTGPELDPARLDEYATGYSSLAYADRRLPIEHIDTGAMASATGFFSTASDVVHYLAAHFHGDDRLLSDDGKRQMQRTEWKVDGGETEYGLGFAIQKIGDRRVLGHGGGYPGHITRSIFDPVDRLAVSVLTNAIDGPAQSYATAAVHLIDLAASGAATAPPSDTGGDVDVDSFCGRFAQVWGIYDIAALGGQLYQLDPNAPDPAVEPMRLDVVDANTLRYATAPGYASPGELLHFERHDDGMIRSVRAGSGGSAHPIELITAAVAARDRITLGDPLRPLDN